MPNLLRAVADAEVKRTLEGGSTSLDVYGLDKPEAIVSMALANGTKLPSIRVGKTAPVGFSAYAQLEGTSDVKIVPSVFQTGMKREVKDLRNKTIIDFQDADVQQVEITTPQSTIHLVRQGDGWALEKPLAAKADTTEVTSFLSALRGARAEEFVDQPAALGELRSRRAAREGRGAHRQGARAQGAVARRRKGQGFEERPLGKATGRRCRLRRRDLDVERPQQGQPWRFATRPCSRLTRRASAPSRSRGATARSFRLRRKWRRCRSATPAPASTPSAEPAETIWKVDGAKDSNAAAIRDLVADLHGLKGYEIAAEKPTDLAEIRPRRRPK